MADHEVKILITADKSQIDAALREAEAALSGLEHRIQLLMPSTWHPRSWHRSSQGPRP